MIKNGQLQLTLDKFFSKTHTHDLTTIARPTANTTLGTDHTTTDSTTAQPPPTQRIERTPGRPPDAAIRTRPLQRTSTTQQRMTAFPPAALPNRISHLNLEILRTSEIRNVLRSGTSQNLAKSLCHRLTCLICFALSL